MNCQIQRCDPSSVVTDANEANAYVARSRTVAVGAAEDCPPLFVADRPQARVDLNSEYGFAGNRADHSGQFQRDIQFMYQLPNGNPVNVPLYWRLMSDLRVKPSDNPNVR